MSTPLWNSTALAFQLPEGVTLPGWWARAEALGWPHETCASAARLVAERTRRVYPDPESDRFEVVRAWGSVEEVSAEALGGTYPEWDPVAEGWRDVPWRWERAPVRASEGHEEPPHALLWRRSRELSASARGPG